jgi:hypothetical protein
MQLVINIDERLYEIITNPKKLPTMYHASRCADAVRNGTPLPKGHGRLIDADALGEELHRYTEAPYLYALKVFNDAQTIIEAESEDKE